VQRNGDGRFGARESAHSQYSRRELSRRVLPHRDFSNDSGSIPSREIAGAGELDRVMLGNRDRKI
jgi:hypothetical protein